MNESDMINRPNHYWIINGWTWKRIREEYPELRQKEGEL